MKIQALHKRLSMPLLLTVISATGIGVSFPAQSTSPTESQSTVIAEKPGNRIKKQNYGKPPCTNDLRPPNCSWDTPDGRIGDPLEEHPTREDNPSNEMKEPSLNAPKPQCTNNLRPPNCWWDSPDGRRDDQRNLRRQQQEQSLPTSEPSP